MDDLDLLEERIDELEEQVAELEHENVNLNEALDNIFELVEQNQDDLRNNAGHEDQPEGYIMIDENIFRDLIDTQDDILRIIRGVS